MSKRLKNYPGVGSPDRFDAIVTEGRTMRRRRQVMGAASAGVTSIAVLVLVLALGPGGKTTPSRSVLANEGKVAQTSEPETTVPVTNEEPEFITLLQDDRHLAISVSDPRTVVVAGPLPDDMTSASRQCVTVQVAGSADGLTVAEGHSCRDLESFSDGAPGTAPLELGLTDGVEVGCAAVEERFGQPIPVTERPETTLFVGTLPTDLAPGDYSVTISAVSGFGDGCVGGSENRNTDSELTEIEAPTENSAVITKLLTVG